MNQKEIQVLVDGPYGSLQLNLHSQKYKILMFISGGIGVTPFLSLAKNSILERFAGRELKLIRFLWTGREQKIIDEIIATEFDSF